MVSLDSTVRSRKVTNLTLAQHSTPITKTLHGKASQIEGLKITGDTATFPDGKVKRTFIDGRINNELCKIEMIQSLDNDANIAIRVFSGFRLSSVTDTIFFNNESDFNPLMHPPLSKLSESVISFMRSELKGEPNKKDEKHAPETTLAVKKAQIQGLFSKVIGGVKSEQHFQNINDFVRLFSSKQQNERSDALDKLIVNAVFACGGLEQQHLSALLLCPDLNINREVPLHEFPDDAILESHVSRSFATQLLARVLSYPGMHFSEHVRSNYMENLLIKYAALSLVAHGARIDGISSKHYGMDLVKKAEQFNDFTALELQQLKGSGSQAPLEKELSEAMDKASALLKQIERGPDVYQCPESVEAQHLFIDSIGGVKSEIHFSNFRLFDQILNSSNSSTRTEAANELVFRAVIGVGGLEPKHVSTLLRSPDVDLKHFVPTDQFPRDIQLVSDASNEFGSLLLAHVAKNGGMGFPDHVISDYETNRLSKVVILSLVAKGANPRGIKSKYYDQDLLQQAHTRYDFVEEDLDKLESDGELGPLENNLAKALQTTTSSNSLQERAARFIASHPDLRKAINEAYQPLGGLPSDVDEAITKQEVWYR